MQNRFRDIAHALNGDGPYRPTVGRDANGKPERTIGASALIPYPRETEKKFAGRNAAAWFVSPLAQAVDDFVSFMASRGVLRDPPNGLYQAMADDIDGKGNAIDVFWQDFMREAKARGSMLLLIDMPAAMPDTLGEQIARRAVPFFMPIAPENVTKYQLGDDGKFDFVEFPGTYQQPDGSRIDVIWGFDRFGWHVRRGEQILDAGEHAIGECPVLIFTERGDFPCFGQFAALEDISRRLFNAQSELDEILRGQTFSLLTQQVPDGTTDEAKLAIAKTTGETIGTQNLMIHTGQTPSFIAPPEGPARIYMDMIAALREQAADIGLMVRMPEARESGIALQMRFQRLNAALAAFARRMEDFERRCWEIARRYLMLDAEVTVNWPNDYQLADVRTELEILAQMQLSAMPRAIVAEQQKRIVALQFSNKDQEELNAIIASIDEAGMEVPTEKVGSGDTAQDAPQDAQDAAPPAVVEPPAPPVIDMQPIADAIAALKPPVVNVKVDAPTIHVPEPVINVAAPVVNVTAPEPQPAPPPGPALVVNTGSNAKIIDLVRDEEGNVTGASVREAA